MVLLVTQKLELEWLFRRKEKLDALRVRNVGFSLPFCCYRFASMNAAEETQKLLSRSADDRRLLVQELEAMQRENTARKAEVREQPYSQWLQKLCAFETSAHAMCMLCACVQA